MKQIFKKIVIRALTSMGFSISRVNHNDIQLYFKIYGKEDVENKRFYNIGAGLFKHPAWTNIDYHSKYYKDNEIHTDCDLLECKPLPIPDNSANIVYSSHTIEHITDEAVQNMLNEAYRILKRGGTIRLAAPNIDLYYKVLLNNDVEFWRWDIDTYSKEENMRNVGIGVPMNNVSMKQIFLFSFASQTSSLHIDRSTQKISDEEFDRIFSERKFEDALNYCKSKCSIELQCKYPCHHINWWNKDKLFRMLRLAGFKNIYLSAYGQSMSPVLRNTYYFDSTCPRASIYVESNKK